MNYCICASGEVGAMVLEFLINQKTKVSCVMTDTNSEKVKLICSKENIPLFAGNPRKGKANDWLNKNGVTFNYLLSVNYLFLLEKDVLTEAELAINFHDSLLPRYRGRCPNVWSIINGEKYTGLTAHVMNEECDDGDIICQEKIKISQTDTGDSIREKTKPLYIKLVNYILNAIESNTLIFIPQDKIKATYYGKRTPNDGQINWEWQKERIYNWVRAQADPYPGAFTYLHEQKITIHQIKYNQLGYVDTVPNGTIIGAEKDNPIVKTQNGAIVLINYTNFEYQIGDRFE